MLLTIDQAKLHLRITDDEHDEELEEMVPEVSEIILNYLKLPSTSWQTTDGEPEDVPGAVKSAVKVAISALFENPEQNPDGPQVLSQAVKDLLHRYRDPAMA
jgi:hypothetical protein